MCQKKLQKELRKCQVWSVYFGAVNQITMEIATIQFADSTNMG